MNNINSIARSVQSLTLVCVFFLLAGLCDPLQQDVNTSAVLWVTGTLFGVIVIAEFCKDLK